MIIIKEPININNIVEMASNRYGDMVKAVADVRRELGEDFIEFDSLINIRPRQNNFSRDVEDVQIQKAIIAITNKYILR